MWQGVDDEVRPGSKGPAREAAAPSDGSQADARWVQFGPRRQPHEKLPFDTRQPNAATLVENGEAAYDIGCGQPLPPMTPLHQEALRIRKGSIAIQCRA